MQRAEIGAFHGRDVNEHIVAAAVRLNEAKTLLAVEPLHGSNSHRCPLSGIESRAAKREPVIKSSERSRADPEARSENQSVESSRTERYSITQSDMYLTDTQAAHKRFV